MTRGDIVVVSPPGDYGKPRPAVVIQSDRLSSNDSVLVVPFTTTSTPTGAPLYRLPVLPTGENGLQAPSQIMVDKVTPIRRAKCGRVIGRLEDDALLALNHMLSVVIGIAD